VVALGLVRTPAGHGNALPVRLDDHVVGEIGVAVLHLEEVLRGGWGRRAAAEVAGLGDAQHKRAAWRQ
jgi:hypothetical protein